MFYDYAKVHIKSGDGGNGIVAFRREKFVPLGGPSGGDGGRGADVILRGDSGLSTLMDFKYKQHYKAGRGENGQNKNRHGAWAEPLVLRVPLGTIIRNAETGNLLGDIVEHGQELIIAKGGRGGRGNARFATQTTPAPYIAEKGEPGQELWITMELKLLADVGLIGLPNAGKSTLISKVSAATPKIADYPFTTLTPNLGVVDLGDGEGFVIADLPGLVEGAADGIGLGHRFLRHAERTRLLLHLVEMQPADGSDPYDNYLMINKELELFRPELAQKKQLVVASKMDYADSKQALADFKAQLGADAEVLPICSLTGEGLKELIYKTNELLSQIPKPAVVEAAPEIKETVVRAEDRFKISRDTDGAFLVSGPDVIKLVSMTDLDNEDTVARLQRIFIKMGLEDALREAGIKPGDLVRIGKDEFEYAE